MARISGVNIPTNKRVHVALTYIYGIGTKIAGEICSKASIDLSKRVNQLTDEEVNSMSVDQYRKWLKKINKGIKNTSIGDSWY